MGWLHQLQSESAVRLARTGLPRRVLRHLIFSHAAGVGTRVLDVGCGCGELVCFFDQLGFNAAGLDDSEAEIRAARRTAPHLDFHCSRFDDFLPQVSGNYDLVIVRTEKPYSDNLFMSEGLRTTANFLSVVRPGGHLVFVVQRDALFGQRRKSHAADCYARHLRGFPGIETTTEFSVATSHRSPLQWVFGGGLQPNVVSATLHIPVEQRSHEGWLELAEDYANSKNISCCRESELAAMQADSEYRAA